MWPRKEARDVASREARERESIGNSSPPKEASWQNRARTPLIVLMYGQTGRRKKGEKQRKTKAKLSARFGNHGKTYPSFSESSVGSRAPKEAELPLESGKTYLKSAISQKNFTKSRNGQLT